MKYVIVAAMSVLLLALSAEAQRNQKREFNQQSRIRQGVKSGELTHREAKKLRKGQKRIDHMQVKAKADGEVTAKEKAKLEMAQDKQSAQIYNLKHNDKQRGDGKPATGNPQEPVPAPQPAPTE